MIHDQSAECNIYAIDKNYTFKFAEEEEEEEEKTT